MATSVDLHDEEAMWFRNNPERCPECEHLWILHVEDPGQHCLLPYCWCKESPPWDWEEKL